jgi:hypothetical protein
MVGFLTINRLAGGGEVGILKEKSKAAIFFPERTITKSTGFVFDSLLYLPIPSWLYYLFSWR